MPQHDYRDVRALTGSCCPLTLPAGSPVTRIPPPAAVPGVYIVAIGRGPAKGRYRYEHRQRIDGVAPVRRLRCRLLLQVDQGNSVLAGGLHRSLHRLRRVHRGERSSISARRTSAPRPSTPCRSGWLWWARRSVATCVGGRAAPTSSLSPATGSPSAAGARGLSTG